MEGEEDHSFVGWGPELRRVVPMSTTADPLPPSGPFRAWPTPWTPCARPWTGSTATGSCGVAALPSPPRPRCAARGTAALSGADWPLEEVRRRSDFSGAGGDEEARTVGAALRLTAEAGQLLSIWRQSPLRVLARLHLVAAADNGDMVGRPRQGGEPVDEPLVELPLPDAQEVAGRLEGLSGLIIAGGSAPALVTAAVVHGELLALRPFGSYNGLVARTAERIVLVGSGLDPKSICPAEVGHAEQGRAEYLAALEGYVSGTPEGVAAWIAHCGRSVEFGARESTAVCEALQRGAA